MTEPTSQPTQHLGADEQRLLDSYRRIGCSEREALVAVGGDFLQRATGPGRDVDEDAARRFLEQHGISEDEVRDALGLRFDQAG